MDRNDTLIKEEARHFFGVKSRKADSTCRRMSTIYHLWEEGPNTVEKNLQQSTYCLKCMGGFVQQNISYSLKKTL